jgi:hypothetical protein
MRIEIECTTHAGIKAANHRKISVIPGMTDHEDEALVEITDGHNESLALFYVRWCDLAMLGAAAGVMANRR